MKTEHLQSCQVATPREIVDLVWAFARAQRPNHKFGKVIDLGAGDARFAFQADAYFDYQGVETDVSKISGVKLPLGAEVLIGDAMQISLKDFDLCIGNPPYIRHHKLDPEWRDGVLDALKARSGFQLKKTANLFILFLMQALLSTKKGGLVVQLIPFEWVSRPSASELRDYIKQQGWDVSVFRFDTDIFPRVLTTASITIIDKSGTSGKWTFAEIGKNGTTKALNYASGSNEVLSYQDRDGGAYGLRGLSPGGQDIFVLTEEERLHFSLQRDRDVIACVTSLRYLPQDVATLNEAIFQKYFVQAGKRCWLIRSDKAKLSTSLQAYISNVGTRWQKYTTCTLRDTWWRYKPHPAPALIISSGFVGKTPKVLVNPVKAIAVGSVYGIITKNYHGVSELADQLRGFDFEKRVVSHSNNLKKVEVRQLNSVLTELTQ
ncbi:MAG: Eco57I restriction-modification methylase domain-containing protein [Aquabacterium sp.]|uniref:Eco57I restriction-modification methylase domain-containing protein n=1 Tax=Aquabacterium sp. TaxID=1872578 RepID=UPI002721AD5C|nr:Eco57I restriction-modification methylase domain-containing protein [Aquabacterium sp.]MDO9006056.1 Eco57I restriction-modification methylase domain-containing protein [Aquabacterium sp.]